MKKYRSNFESVFANHLINKGLPIIYEEDNIKYIIPSSNHIYKPDFKIGNDIYIETKGIFSSNDRKKMIMVIQQHPKLRFIMVFQNWNLPINKGSKTTYKSWCLKNDIECYNKVLPADFK